MVRVSQTKIQLANSLKELMKKVPFHNITVQNVADHCGVNRQTFYYHFKDMYDLLEWIYQNDIFCGFQELSGKNWQAVLLDTIKYAKKNKSFLRNTNRSLRKETIEKYLYPFINQLFVLIFDDVCKDAYIRTEEKDFILKFFTHAYVNVIIQWIGNGMQEEDSFLFEKVQILRRMLQSYRSCQAVPNTITIYNGLQNMDIKNSRKTLRTNYSYAAGGRK
ncbi:TetR/AcrR family transcriptional regulator C-terminal domain-containing protein [Marasmitruncus massiliensis]|uniref:TetR/AcrR family transcriptional regulator C-terminal domain-containing protein n=1 Tax=Marasmitruncus massiliensis TaxID=1944642 RepID=UPI0015E0F141|nr:TetR/AcrR family transcriptional regulator C-terminal domain-containing protein [Marasmitruncus massiliensis]